MSVLDRHNYRITCFLVSKASNNRQLELLAVDFEGNNILVIFYSLIEKGDEAFVEFTFCLYFFHVRFKLGFR